MVFETLGFNIKYKTYPESVKTKQRRVFFSKNILENVNKITKVYNHTYNDFKLNTDTLMEVILIYFINELNQLPEVEGLQLIRELRTENNAN